MSSVLHDHDVIRDLGDGLVLRSARPADADQVVEMNGILHMEHDATEPDESIREWTRDLFELDHPTFRLDEMTVVEDTATGRIVSTVCTIPQTWSYEGAEIAVGRPELVATDPAYRRRGLVRDQFDVLHRRGDQRGELLQFITGIPWYYRQFGYEFALDLPASPVLRPRQKVDAPDERWALRPATADDVSLLARVGEQPGSSSQLRCRRDAEIWRLELSRRPGANCGGRTFVIEERGPDRQPEPIGYATFQNHLWDGLLPLRSFELLPGRSWLGPTAAVLSHARRLAQEPTPASQGRPPLGVYLVLPEQHPALRAARSQVASPTGSPYGLYIRIVDLVGFLRSVSTVLESRLAASPATGFTGSYRVELFTDGVKLDLEEGRVTGIAPWRPAERPEDADVAMPRDHFLHLLLGNRTVGELQRAVADCEALTDAGALLTEVLFPRMSFDEWILG